VSKVYRTCSGMQLRNCTLATPATPNQRAVQKVLDETVHVSAVWQVPWTISVEVARMYIQQDACDNCNSEARCGNWRQVMLVMQTQQTDRRLHSVRCLKTGLHLVSVNWCPVQGLTMY